jgi:hypothetical protein
MPGPAVVQQDIIVFPIIHQTPQGHFLLHSKVLVRNFNCKVSVLKKSISSLLHCFEMKLCPVDIMDASIVFFAQSVSTVRQV